MTDFYIVFLKNAPNLSTPNHLKIVLWKFLSSSLQKLDVSMVCMLEQYSLYMFSLHLKGKKQAVLESLISAIVLFQIQVTGKKVLTMFCFSPSISFHVNYILIKKF